MRENVKKQIRNAKKRRIRCRRFYAAVALCSILVAGIVSWKLILPGTAMSGETYCGKEEHTHSDACYEQVLVCGQEEGAGAHTHTDACYADVRTDQLVCGQEEGAGHVHAEACYTNELICGQEENDEHTHTDDCYEQVLTCGQEEGAGAHTHTDACYATERKLTCGQEEGAGHVHSEACYQTELTCGKEEHKHTLECYSNPDAVETEDQWKAAFRDCELTGEWGKDTAAVAQTQIGYKESTDNYSVGEDGSANGYTRYADWAGDDIYGGWNTDFAAFCLNYAGVPADKFPVNADDLDAWITAMNDSGYYGDSDSTEPQPGDLIVLQKADQEGRQTIGIVSETETDGDGNVTKVKVIEGDCDDEVKENTYAADSAEIVGYGLVNEAYGDTQNSALTDNNISNAKPQKAAALYANDEEKVDDAGNEADGNEGAEDNAVNSIDIARFVQQATVSVLKNNQWVPVTEVKDGDNVQVYIDFAIPADAVNEDINTMIYKVPSEFTPDSPMETPVYQTINGSRVPVGTCRIDTDGTITITLNEDFANGQEFTGYVQFYGKAHINDSETTKEVHFGGTSESITIKKDESTERYDISTEKTLSKSEKTENGWEITYKVTVSSEKGTEKEVTIQDRLNEVTGGTAGYNAGSFTIKHFIGGVEDSDFQGNGPVINSNDRTFVYENLPNLGKNESYEVTYTVEVTESEGGDGYVKIGNYAAGSSGNQSPGDYNEKILSDKVIEKSGYYDSNKGMIKWTIVVNSDGEKHTVKDILPKNIEIKGNVTITKPDYLQKSMSGDQFREDGFTIAENDPGRYTFEFYTNAPEGEAGKSFTVTNEAEVDEKYRDDSTVSGTHRDWSVDKNSAGDRTENGTTYHQWNASVNIPFNEPLKSVTYTDEILDPVITEESETAQHYGIASVLDKELRDGIKFTVQEVDGIQRSYKFSDEDSPVTISITYYDSVGNKVDSADSTTQIKKFEITVTPKDNKTVYGVKLETGNYSTVVDLSDVAEGSTVTFQNKASISGHEDTAEFTTEKKNIVEKSAAVPNGGEIQNGSYQQNITTDYNAENGIIWYRVLYRTSADENGDVILKDQIPQGMTYVEGSLTARYTNGNFTYQPEFVWFKESTYNIRENIIYKYDSTSNILTVKIPDEYNGVDGLSLPNDVVGVVVYYALQYTEDGKWENDETGQVTYSNTVSTGGHDSSSTVTVNKEDREVIWKSSEQLKDETDHWTDSVKYYIVINPDAKDLEPNLDYLTLTDTISSDSVNELTLDLGETHLYELDLSNAEGHYIKEDAEVDKERYSLTYDYTTHKMTVTIPDSFACVLTYVYHVDRGNFNTSELSNSVDLMGRWSDKEEDTVQVNDSEAGVSRDGNLKIYKVDGDDYNKRLQGAEFTLEQYDSEVESSWKLVQTKNNQNVFTTDANGMITFSLSSNDSILEPLTLYRLKETKQPAGYEHAAPVTFYFVILGDGSKKHNGVSYDTSDKEGAINYMNATDKFPTGDEEYINQIRFIGKDIDTDIYLENTNNSLTVKKIWQDSNGKQIDGTSPVELEIYAATLGQDGCEVTINGIGGGYSYTKTEILKKGSTVHVVINDTYSEQHQNYRLSIKGEKINNAFYPVEADGQSDRIAFDIKIPDDADRLNVDLEYIPGGWVGPISEFNGISADHVYNTDSEPTYKITLGSNEESSDGSTIQTTQWSYTIDNISSPGENKFWIVREVTTGNWTTIYQNNQSQTGEITVYNQLIEQYILPETGGIGTKVYIAGGTILMMSSCLLGGYRMRRKRERRRR